MDLDNLPHDSKLSILLLLDYKSMIRMTIVSKCWHGLLSQNQAFWREKFELDFGEWEGEEGGFEAAYKIEYGWRFREPKVIDLEEHEGWIHGLTLQGSQMVSCGADANACVWNLDSMECLCKFPQGDDTYAVAFDGEKVFVGLQNGMVHVWDLDSRELCHSWRSDGLWVCALPLVDGYLISGGRHCLRVWDSSTFECLQYFEIKGFKWLHVDGNEIICGLWGERQVAVFHREDGLLYTLAVGEMVYSVCADSRHIYVGCGNEHVQVWDRETRERAIMLHVGTGYIQSVWCDAKKLITVSSTGSMMIFNPTNFQQIRQMEVDVDLVRRVECYNGRMFIGTGSGLIRVLDFVW